MYLPRRPCADFLLGLRKSINSDGNNYTSKLLQKSSKQFASRRKRSAGNPGSYLVIHLYLLIYSYSTTFRVCPCCWRSLTNSYYNKIFPFIENYECLIRAMIRFNILCITKPLYHFLFKFATNIFVILCLYQFLLIVR